MQHKFCVQDLPGHRPKKKKKKNRSGVGKVRGRKTQSQVQVDWLRVCVYHFNFKTKRA